MRKPVFGVSDQVKPKPACSADETSSVLLNRPGVLWLQQKFRIGWNGIWREEKNKTTGITLFLIYLISATSSDD